ncbi:MAG: MFS transporter [Patescibacteria group bacterium]|nr:MFS transporter [Patescibacteria group bacterium]
MEELTAIRSRKGLSQLLNISYFSKDFKIICCYQLILKIIDGMIGLFLPIFLLEAYHQSLSLVIIFYIIGYTLFGLLVPLGAIIMSKIGLKQSMISARLISVLFYLFLFYFKNNPLVFSILAIAVLMIFRMLYWTPYHSNFTHITHRDSRGKQVAYVAIVGYITSMAAPLLAGFVLYQYGFNFMFILGIIIVGLSVIPLFFLTPVPVKFEFSFWQTFKEWAKKENANLRIAYISNGAQDLVGAIIWPIFIYQLLEKQYLAVGAVSALIIGGTILLYLFTGQYTDKFNKKKILRYGSFIYSVGWLLKTIISTAFQIFVIGTIHSFTAVLLNTPFSALMYEKAADRGSYVDEYTVLMEISDILGRILMGLLILGLLWIGGFKIIFILAALFSLLINLL